MHYKRQVSAAAKLCAVLLAALGIAAAFAPSGVGPIEAVIAAPHGYVVLPRPAGARPSPGTSLRPARLARGVALPRATEDRPDDVSGPQVHLVYAIPADGVDRQADMDGSLDGSVAGMQGWFRGQTGGPALRIDTYQGQPDITFVRLPRTDAAYLASGSVGGNIVGDLQVATYKLEAVYYDGTAPDIGGGFTVCGQGGRARVPVAIVYLKPGCLYDLAASQGGAFGTLESTLAHEAVHGMGFVPSCAPHTTHDGHVNDSPIDLMAPVLQLGAQVLDVNHDDYFRAGVSGCQDLTGSRFLEGGGKTLTVAVTRDGGDGTVTGPDGIACPPACTTQFDSWDATATAELTATAAAGSAFLGWQGCSSATETCVAAVQSSLTVTARFGKPPPAHVPVTVAIAGSGLVLSSPAGIECPRRCRASFAVGTAVRLTALPSQGWRFSSWSGSCSGHASCTVRPRKATSVRATFRRR